MNTLKLYKVTTVPASPAEENALYFVKDPTSGAVDLWVTDATGVPFHVDVDSANAREIVKTLIIEDPSAAENISMFYTDSQITISKMVAVLVGGSLTPTVTWTVRFASDRSSAGTEVVTAGTTTTDMTTGQVITTLSNPVIPANSFVWLQTTDKGGVIQEFNVSIIYTKDTN